jgi:4-hydroxybenzoate polyprenyltransferase
MKGVDSQEPGFEASAVLLVAPIADFRDRWVLWARQLRLVQWIKNVLLFVPLLSVHRFAPDALFTEARAAIAFCFCASCTYILNDLIDLPADRVDPRNCNRPLASGALAIPEACVAMPVLLALAFSTGATVSLPFLAILGAYWALSTAYSLFLKRKLFIDVVVLAVLYTMRVFAGGVALDIAISEWLLGASVLAFMSLALIKRHADLSARLDAGLGNPTNRDYRIGDLEIIAALSAASGFNAATVLALWISSDTVRQLYHHPTMLWLICPIFIYWFGRLLMLVHRRLVNGDLFVFALTDTVSVICLAALLLTLLAAI